MKKILCIALALMLLVGCTKNDSESTQRYITGVWISFSELDEMLKKDFKTEFGEAIKNCKSREITDVFVHIRPFCDSYYPSKYFPLRTGVSAHNFDVVEYMINVCHQNGIKFHAWLNPYRVRTADSNTTTLPDNSPAKQWLEDQDLQNDLNVSLVGGIYLNPASSEVRKLIINGIREIIDNYEVDGIHFDDYFYPTTDASFDQKSYEKYCANTKKPLSLDEWRRANVNSLISGTYTAIKFKNKNIVFSISPSASIKENYNKHYADIDAWCKNSCIDYIMPQLYFGFDYPDTSFRFNNLVNDWILQLKNTDTKLLIGIAAYKINTKNPPDCDEWQNGEDVINRQIDICNKTDNISGHVYFSYTSMCEYL